MASRFRRAVAKCILIGGGSLAAVYGLTSFYDMKQTKLYMSTVEAAVKSGQSRPTAPLLPRAAQLKALQETPEYDILVIGGGATGAGVVLDAVSRGLKAAVIEIDDFSSGTSSRSTKLIHGGVRYLQKAIMKLDYEQYRMVKEALYERANLLAIAPHLSTPLPIMLPVYRWWQVPYYWFGIKAYDIVAGTKLVKSSYYLSKSKALELFPMLKKDKLCGAIVYYDGQHNDARMNVALVLTAARMGATVANHVGATSIIKKMNEEGKLVVSGAKVMDMLTEYDQALQFLKLEMGQDVNKASKENLDINLTKEEIRSYVRRFETLDSERKGFISVNDLRRSFKKHKESITEEQLHELLREVDLNKNGEIDLSEYLQMMNAIKSGVIAYSRLAMIADTAYQQKLSVERSGGGL